MDDMISNRCRWCSVGAHCICIKWLWVACFCMHQITFHITYHDVPVSGTCSRPTQTVLIRVHVQKIYIYIYYIPEKQDRSISISWHIHIQLLSIMFKKARINIYKHQMYNVTIGNNIPNIYISMRMFALSQYTGSL